MRRGYFVDCDIKPRSLQMTEPDTLYWKNYIEYLSETFTKSGLSERDAQIKAQSYNIWSKLGFSFCSLQKEFKRHSSQQKDGYLGDSFPQVSYQFFMNEDL